MQFSIAIFGLEEVSYLKAAEHSEELQLLKELTDAAPRVQESVFVSNILPDQYPQSTCEMGRERCMVSIHSMSLVIPLVPVCFE